MLLVLFAGIGSLAVSDLIQGDGEAAMFLALLPVVFLAVYRRCWWTQLVLTSDRIVVRNAIKQYVVPLTSVAGLDIGQRGIIIETLNDEPVIVSVAQKGLATELLGRYTYADEILADLATAVDAAYRRAGASPPEELHHAVQPVPPRRKQRSVASNFVKWMLLVLTLLCLALFAVSIAVLVTNGAFVGQAGISTVDWITTLVFASLTASFATGWHRLRRRTKTG